MKQASVLIVLYLLSSLVFGGHAKTFDRSVLAEGTTIVAGDSRKNEFYIVHHEQVVSLKAAILSQQHPIKYVNHSDRTKKAISSRKLVLHKKHVTKIDA